MASSTGDQLGDIAGSAAFVIWTALPSGRPCTQIWSIPDRSLTKAISVPSGDSVGIECEPTAGVTSRAPSKLVAGGGPSGRKYQAVVTARAATLAANAHRQRRGGGRTCPESADVSSLPAVRFRTCATNW
jgi:hypothetical protein